MKTNKKAIEIGISTLFYILMGIFMIWIIVFGYQKIMGVNELISEQDRAKIKNELKNALEYCNDPLNQGSTTRIQINHKAFNSLCMINPKSTTGFISVRDEDAFSTLLANANTEFGQIADTQNNVIVLKTEFVGSKGNEKMTEFQIIDTFKIDGKIQNQCILDKENTGKLDLIFTCN